jgi:hypothetical protein
VDVDVIKQFAFGGAVSALTIAVHAMVMTLVIRAAQRMAAINTSRPLLFLTGLMTVTVLILMVAHTSEVLIWALAYLFVGATASDSGYVYFAFVNYTTLGYGDVLPVKQWQLLGPITAMNGVLLFGWSTAVIFEVLRRSLLVGSPQMDRPGRERERRG